MCPLLDTASNLTFVAYYTLFTVACRVKGRKGEMKIVFMKFFMLCRFFCWKALKEFHNNIVRVKNMEKFNPKFYYAFRRVSWINANCREILALSLIELVLICDDISSFSIMSTSSERNFLIKGSESLLSIFLDKIRIRG